MTLQDRQLLIQDLCGRLPYCVIVQVNDGLKGTYDSRLVQVFCDRLSCSVNVRNPLKECVCIDSVKPYLLPMSSMTEEEKKDYIYLCEKHLDRDADDNVTYYYFDTVESIDWLNAHHFDYRGLIERNLAIDCSNLNIYD